MPLRAAIRAAIALPIDESAIRDCVDTSQPAEELFERARKYGLATIERSQRSGHLARVTGEVAESVAEIILDEHGYSVFWQIPTSGAHGVDLLLIGPDHAVLALEVKGTLRPGATPRLTPSHQRQMSREWLNNPRNPGMADWSFEAEDLYAGVMVVDLAMARFRLVVSGDFEHYMPVTELEQLQSVRAIV
ncbi:MAG: hypothetical protein ABSC51_11455 [Gaiellaceae bacterium]|jgi:hypothetical protein